MLAIISEGLIVALPGPRKLDDDSVWRWITRCCSIACWPCCSDALDGRCVVSCGLVLGSGVGGSCSVWMPMVGAVCGPDSALAGDAGEDGAGST